MTLGAACLVANDALVKLASAEVPSDQIIFIRALVILAVCALATRGRLGLRSLLFDRDLLLRTGFAVANTFAFVAAVTSLPFAVAVLVDYSSLLFVSVLAPLLLSERLRVLRLAAILPGMVGCYLILSPEQEIYGWLIALPILSAVTGAIRDVWTRRPVFNDLGVFRLTFHAAIGLCLAGLLAADFSTWTALSPLSLLTCLAAGLLQALALLFTAKSFLVGEATLVAPFRLSAVVWTLLISAIAFEERLQSGQVLGIAAIAIALAMTLRAK